MKKLALAVIAAMYVFAFVGCDQESGAKKETTIKTDNGEVKKTEEVKVEKKGDAKDTATSPAM
jgi:hypothetical protein